MADSNNIFTPGKNCWRTGHIEQAAMLIDCANFYRALHSSIIKARKNIYIVGWDIDSRMRLLRGTDEENSPYPSVVRDLLIQKAEENPDLDIYLLRWDSSLSFLEQRELMSQKIWEVDTPGNIKICMDRTIPMGGSHHQKIIIIDDEIVFSGGMDIAPGRWDERAHNINEPERYDDLGPYDPYHDIQIVMHGPAVRDYHDLVRWRWENATKEHRLPPFKPPLQKNNAVPASWPDNQEIWFENMPYAIARTLPEMGDNKPVHEVIAMYCGLIAEAEDFIYIENQFYTHEDIAKALNSQLKKVPGLRVIMAGPCNPQGVCESEGMWGPRLQFKKIVEDGIKDGKVIMSYPIMHDTNGKPHNKRIHSKVMIIDDSYITIGSANICRRSMSMDTECDFILYGDTPKARASIAHVRNNLLAEHTCRSEKSIQDAIDEKQPVTAFLGGHHPGQCHLEEIDDTRFTEGKFTKWARPLVDPEEPLIPNVIPVGGQKPLRNPRRHIFFAAVGGLALLGLFYGLIGHYSEWVSPETIEHFLERIRGTSWAMPIVCLVYIIGGLAVFPVTVLSLATTAVFGALWGPIYAMIGALCSAAVLYWAGLWAGDRALRKYLGQKVQKLIDRLKENSITGIVIIRLTPVAPYTLVNMAAGIVRIKFSDFMIGTFLGLSPGLLAKAFLGDSLMQVFLHPTSENYIYMGAGILFWLAIVIGTQKLVKRLAKKQKNRPLARQEA